MKLEKCCSIRKQSKLNADIDYYAALGELQFPDKEIGELVVKKPPKKVVEEVVGTSIKRPAAVYSNTPSPYGIADQLHRIEAVI